MGARHAFAVALAAGALALACNQLFGIEDGNLVTGDEGGADAAPVEAAAGGDAGTDGADGAPACHVCAGSEACVDGVCQPEIVVDDSHGLGTLGRLELRGDILYGTSAGGGPDAGRLWRASTTPDGGFAYLPGTNTDNDVGGFALDDTYAWFGLVTGSVNRGVWKVSLDAGADAAATYVSSNSVPTYLAVDGTGPYTYAANGTTIIRDGKSTILMATCTDTGGTITDLVTDTKGNVYWSGPKLGRSTGTQTAAWGMTVGSVTIPCTDPVTNLSLSGLGVDATYLYMSEATSRKIRRMKLVTCSPATCSSAGNADCGAVPDGCGGFLDCGTCSGPNTCGGGGSNRCGTGSCAQKSCADLGANCGLASDTCGHLLDCGVCSAPQWCGGGGVANVCGGTLDDLTATVALPSGPDDAPGHLVSDGTRVYWGSGGGNIWAIAADGSSTRAEPVLHAPVVRIGAIATDMTSSFVYFTDDASHRVYRVSK
jgi:hypothetical protein